MANGEPKFNERQQGILRALDDRYAKRFETPEPFVSPDERPPLDSYSQDIVNLLGGQGFKDSYTVAEKEAMDNMLKEADIDVESFFKNKPKATTVDVMRAANYLGFSDREKRYKAPETFKTEEARSLAMLRLSDEHDSKFQNNMVLPVFGTKLADIVPKSIIENDQRRADFERAINLEYGLSLDFDGSGNIGDLHTDNTVANGLRRFRYDLNDVGVVLIDEVLGIGNAMLDATSYIDDKVFGIDSANTSDSNEAYRLKKEAGEAQSTLESAQTTFGSFNLNDGLFWDALYSTDARRDFIASKTNASTTTMQQLQEGAEGSVWTATVDQFIGSIPLMLDVVTAKGIAKKGLKKATQKVSKKASAKYTVRESGRFADPKTGRFMSREAAEKIQKKAARINDIIVGSGGFVIADGLISAGIHADNVGQEWYDNLSPQERFSYLAQQSSAETLSAMVLENAVTRGFKGIKTATQGVFRAEKTFFKEWGKTVADNFLVGASREAAAEAGTAAWQYASEIQARKAGGDETAVFESEVFLRRIQDGAEAGALLGGFGGLAGGLTGGAASAYISTRHPNAIAINKKLEKLAEDLANAPTEEARVKAAERLEVEVQKHSGAKSSITRAYYAISQQNPEAFSKIGALQGEINKTVHRFKKSVNDPEAQETQKRELERLIEEKQSLENQVAKEMGLNSFDEVISGEVGKLSEERGEKLNNLQEKKRNSPEAEAERILEEELDEQRTSLEAAIAVNSAEQSADDDVQDAPEGQPTQKQPTQEKKSNKAEDLPEGSKNQEGKVGEPLDTMAIDSPRYREIAEKANVLLKSFKGVIGNVVIHTTAESFQKATNKDPKKTKGAITHRGAQKSTVHINLSHSNANIRTVRHEFLHAAFLGKSFKAKKALLKELQSVVKRYGDATADFGEGETITLKELIARIEQAYEGNEDIVEETVVNALEYFLNQDIFSKNPSLGQRILNAWNSFFGSAVEKSDLEGFVQAFRDAESGKDFDVDLDKAQEAANQDRDMESRDLGPSRAYPDLQNSEVSYWIRNVNKMGGDMYNREQKVFKDYWHFRNWWAQETGNGKKASMIGGFEYIGKDGKKKTVNEPKPKVDRNTGEIVDMKPRLKTFNEWKKERLDKNTEARRQRINVETITTFIGFDVLKFIDNEFGRTTGIYDFEARPTQVPEGFDTDETFEFSGDQSMSYKSLKKAQREAEDLVTEIARAIPPNQRGKFMFRVTEKSKGVAQVELLSDSPGLYAQLKEAADAELDLDDSVSVFGGLESIDDIKSNGDAIAGGEVKTLESVVLEELKISKSNNLGKDVNRGSVYELNGLLCRAFGYDRTKINSGVRNLFDRADKAITAHKSKQDAENVFLSLREMAATVIREKGLKVGEIGYIATMQTLLGEESTLGNPNVFLDIINGKEGYFNVDSVGKALNRKGTGKNKAKFTGKTQKFRAKILQGLAVGDNQSLKDIQNAIRNDGNILLTQESLDVIKEILEDSSEDLSFKDRTAIANSFLDSSQKELIYAKHNDSVWANVGLAETVSYTIIPFKYEGETENGNIKISGFNTDIDQNKKSAF